MYFITPQAHNTNMHTCTYTHNAHIHISNKTISYVHNAVVLFTLNSKLYMYVQVAIIIANHFNII